MKNIIYKITALIFILYSAVSAQSVYLDNSLQGKVVEYVPGTIEEIAISYGLMDILPAITNTSHIIQNGSDNAAYISQVSNNNIGIIIQNSNNNNSQLTQSGSGNNNVLVQNGTFNSITSNVSGDLNNSLLVQDGTNNKINQDLGVSGRNYYFMQLGANNTIMQDENSQVYSKSYSIYQIGNDMHLIITNSHF